MSDCDPQPWIQQHGVVSKGTSWTLHLLIADIADLCTTFQIPSCASWNIPELGVGQQSYQHEGFRGTLGELLEKTRRDIERNRAMYGEAAAPQFDAVLKSIDQLLMSDKADQEERRIDLSLDNTAVTYSEMLQGHRDEGLSEDQLQEHWTRLDKVDSHAAAVSVSFSVRDPSGLCAVPSELIGCIAEQAGFLRSEADNKALGLDEEHPYPVPAKQLSSVSEIAELVRQSKRVVVLTGAGISVESGITPFRNPSADDAGSIWGTFDAAKMTVQNFNTDPAVAGLWWAMKRSLVKETKNAVPNPAHTFFAFLEQQGKLGKVVTQNIDSLHHRAGVSADKVIELHGHMRGLVCSDNPTLLNPIPYKAGSCTFAIPEEDVDALKAAYEGEPSNVPLCPDCGCPLRTETVMFGQPMPEQEVLAASDAIDSADLLLIIGSTLIVQPANELPSLALRNGTPVVMINFDPTQYDIYCKGLVRQKAGEFLKAVTDELKRVPQSIEQKRELQRDARVAKITAQEVKQARVAKEGHRLGKEISVNARACGMTFFCTAVAAPEGDVTLLEQSLAAMNLECGEIGKMIFSDGVDQLAVVAAVPDAHAGLVNCKLWLQEVAHSIGGDVLDATENSGRLVVRAGADVHPIKLKEPGITAAIRFLKERGLFPESNDEDEIIYGDHDFPLC